MTGKWADKTDKTCKVCGKVLPLNMFHKHVNGKYGVRADCKVCRNAYIKEHDTINKERYAERRKARYIANRASICEKSIAYYNSHKKERRAYLTMRRLTDEMFRFKERIRGGLRDAFRKRGYSKKNRTYMIVGLSFDDLLIHLENTFLLNYGRCITLNDDVHIDHIIPMSSAKTTEDVILLSHYTNLQYLLAKDNMRKQDRIGYEITTERGQV